MSSAIVIVYSQFIVFDMITNYHILYFFLDYEGLI